MENADNVQVRVLAIVRAALLDDSIGMENNIFEAGGDSLKVLEICSSIEADFDIEIPLESVWDALNIAELVSVVEVCVAHKVAEDERAVSNG